MLIEIIYTNDTITKIEYDGTMEDLHQEFVALNEGAPGHFSSCGLKKVGNMLINSSLVREIKEA